MACTCNPNLYRGGPSRAWGLLNSQPILLGEFQVRERERPAPEEEHSKVCPLTTMFTCTHTPQTKPVYLSVTDSSLYTHEFKH